MALGLLILCLNSAVFADGFICENAEQTLQVQVYHQTRPELGTRNVATMIVANPSAPTGHQTIAIFTSDNAQLRNKSTTYAANVNLEALEDESKNLAVTSATLGELKRILLRVDYRFGHVLAPGQVVTGAAILTRRSGPEGDLRVEMSCVRYLKSR